MKFGGTSVADMERIGRVADFVEQEARAGVGVAVIVSAMAGETNRLVELCRAAGGPVDGALRDIEYDAVVSAGEQVTSGLLAATLQSRGRQARSWLGWQIPLRTDGAHGKARIADVDGDALGAAIDKGEIAVIAGFQGIAPDGRIATLGRGGSDTTAVAIAAALEAGRCDIYTDVDGVYTTDPRMVRAAQKIEKISYEEMLEMASMGAKVLQTRSVELAMAKSVRLRVLSSFTEAEPDSGTIVCNEDDIVEKQIVSGIAYSLDEARVNLLTVEDHPGMAATIFSRLADANVNVDMIVQSAARVANAANITFTVPSADLARTTALMNDLREELDFMDITSDDSVAKVSVIGVGMKSHAGVAKTMFQALADKGINIHVISTSEIKISVLIDAEYLELAVRTLHAAYGLDSEAA